MHVKSSYDVIVVGGGAMGTAAAWALGKRGFNTLVLEQFNHVHDKGSHGGETRIIRHAYAESPEYVPLVLHADSLWQELEAETGESLLIRCGGLELAAPGFSHARLARASADEHSLPYEWLSPAEARARWPTFRIPDDWDALYSPDSGFLLTDSALHGMGAEAMRHGVTIADNRPVLAWGEEGDSVWVETAEGRDHAASLIITAGAWAGKIMADLALPLHVLRKTLWWQRVNEPERYQPKRFPVFISDSAAGEIYGFPAFGTPSLKIANHKGGDITDPETVDRATKSGENADCLEFANVVLPGVTAQVEKSSVCLYTMTPDSDFVVDRHPSLRHVTFGAGFSGHGFKFAPAIGELLADMATDPRSSPIPRLRVSRFNRVPLVDGSRSR